MTMVGSSRSAEQLRDVIGCVTHGRLIARPVPGGIGETVIEFEDPAPVRTAGALRGSAIDVKMTLADSGDVAGYAFKLIGTTGAELLAWHWHPAPEFPAPTFPHLHVSSSLRIAGPGGERGVVPLDKRHLPTGIVSLAAFVRMLIEEFGIEPLARDWPARLADA